MCDREAVALQLAIVSHRQQLAGDDLSAAN